MFSPLNDPQVEQWFQRFNAPLKHLPVAERLELHSEVRQHLDALVAANEELGSSSEEAWELALTQFGEPARIGQRLFQECQESQSGSRLGWSAVGLGIVLYMGCIIVDVLRAHFYGIMPGNVFLSELPALMSFAVGRKYPFHAIRGTLYAFLFWRFVFLSNMVTLMLNPHNETYGNHTFHVTVSLDLLRYIGLGLIGMVINCGSAYLASVTKRGWYKPSLGDFKLTLPRRRPQPSR